MRYGGESVSETYLRMLEDTVKYSPFMQVTNVYRPIVEEKVHIIDYLDERFRTFKFSDGRTGEWWIEDRIKALFDKKGEYRELMHRDDQYGYVLQALDKMKKGKFPRWNANRLIITLFSPSDLHKARAPTPPCLLNICFYPVKNELSLIGTFRAQYTDAKAYGNLISLAMLLNIVCKDTGFHPANLYSIAQKAILKYKKGEARDLLRTLLGFK